MYNETLNTIFAHRSIRRYRDQAIDSDTLNTLLRAGIAASSSCHMQAISILRISDPALRQQLAELGGKQDYIAQAPEFLVFFIDYTKLKSIVPDFDPSWNECLLMGAIDAGIMAQNILLAAESLGLGGVYIGGLRNSISAISQLLCLPENTALLFGMCLGYPDQDPLPKPRFAPELFVAENHYRSVDPAQLGEFDAQSRAYYRQRGSEQAWSDVMRRKFSGAQRPEILPYLQQHNLAKK